MVVKYLNIQHYKFAGVYKITNLVNNKSYIGSSTYLVNRLRGHIQDLKKGTHRNTHLQSSINKYGFENFVFEVLKVCSQEELLDCEQWFIDNLHPEYNICKVAGNTFGVCTPQTPLWVERRMSKRRIPIKVTNLISGECLFFDSIKSTCKAVGISEPTIINSLKTNGILKYKKLQIQRV